MKSMFKKVLHVLLAIAIIYACPFSVSAHDENVTPYGFGCAWGDHANSDIVEVSSTTCGPDENYCSYDLVEKAYECPDCHDQYGHFTEEENHVSHSIDTILEDASDNADYGPGAMFETTYCLNCGYILSQEVIYFN